MPTRNGSPSGAVELEDVVRQRPAEPAHEPTGILHQDAVVGEFLSGGQPQARTEECAVAQASSQKP